MTERRKSYWFARFRPLTREDFGYTSSEIPNLDLFRDRYRPFSAAWRYSFVRPIAWRGWLVAWGILLGLILLPVGLGLETGEGAVLAVTGFCILAYALATSAGRTDPAKFVEEYDQERDQKLIASGRAPWLAHEITLSRPNLGKARPDAHGNDIK